MRVVIADDHPLYLAAIRVCLERLFVSVDIVEAGSLPEALGKMAQEAPPTLVLLDFSMPGMNGAQGVKAAVEKAGGAPVVVMSGVANRQDVGACVAAGARGFIPKTLEPNLFGAVLNMVVMGGSYIPAEYLERPAPVVPRRQVTEPLSQEMSSREVDVLEMLAKGCSNKEIARELKIQEVTVKLYLSRVFQKLGVRNRAQAAVKALEHGMIRSAPPNPVLHAD